MMEDEKLFQADWYQIRDPQDGLPLILLHGAVVSKENWLPQLQRIDPKFRVITVDFPGHGALSQLSFSFQRSIQLIAEVLRETGPAVIAGMSLGGYVAIEFACQFPQLTRGLVLSGCRSKTNGIVGLYLHLFGRLVKAGLLKQNYKQLQSRVRRMYSPQLQEAAEAQLNAGVFPEVMGDVLLEMAGKNYGERLKQYPGPIVLLNGKGDRSARRGAEKIRKQVPGVTESIIPEAGHSCHLEQPEVFTAALETIAFSMFKN